MVYETSYESGRKPFVPDAERGKWGNPNDFIYVCMSAALKLDLTLIFWYFISSLGVVGLLLYLICLAMYVVPLLIIQSFMGQFSSSGYLSAFRISPLFKGMGYVSLLINFLVLTTYGIFAAVPLLFMVNAVRPTLPWSCEAFKEWGKNVTSICNLSSTASMVVNDNYSYEFETYHIPSVVYFRSHVGASSEILMPEDSEHFFSWAILLCLLTTWAIVGAVLHKFFNPEMLGTIIRYAVWTVMALMAICMLRFVFLPGVAHGLVTAFTRNNEGGVSIIIYATSAFGAGWGSVITMSSFNTFRTDIVKQSWLIGLGQMFIFVSFTILISMVEFHIAELTGESFWMFIESHWSTYLSSGSVIASLEMPNLWTFLFFGMQVLASLIILVSQTFSLLVTLFDDFESLRTQKKEVVLGTVSLMTFVSLYFSTNHGILYFANITADTLVTQTALNLLLLLVVLWIYGRERFQRDFEFMLNQKYATWKVHMLRFVTPIFLCFTLFFGLIYAFFEHAMNQTIAIHVCALVFVVLPWLFIPGYGIYNILQLIGSWKTRFWRCCRPTDWYPVGTEERQAYEEAVGANERNQDHQVLEEVT